MIIKVNGKEVEIDKGSTLLCITERVELAPERIVVEYNKEIIPKDSLGNIVVSETDSVEILSFVGGG